MRFILIYRSPIFHSRRERFDIQCKATDQIIQALEKKLSHFEAVFAFRIMNDSLGFRIIKGWGIEHYNLIDGSEIEIDLLDNSEDEIIRISKNAQQTKQMGIKRLDSYDAGKEVFVDQGDDTFNLRNYLDKQCEKMLKCIQKNNMKEFLSTLQEIPEIEGISNDYIKGEKQKIIDELGLGGWGAIHFAVYLNRKDFVTELVKRKVNLSKVTADGWLPLQIAVNRRNQDLIKFLIQQRSLNINATSPRGSALHVAVMNEYIAGIKLLLTKSIDTKILDEKGRTCSELTSNQQCLSLVKEKQDSYQIRQICQEKDIIISLPFTVQILRGYVFKVKNILLNLSQRYLVLDPFEATLIRYQDEESYPKKPKEVIPFANIKTVKIIKDKSWPMKKEYTYFEIYTPQRIIFACRNQKIAERWVKGIFDTVLFTVQVEKNKLLKEKVPRKTVLLDDIKNLAIDLVEKKQKVPSPTKSFVKRTSVFEQSQKSPIKPRLSVAVKSSSPKQQNKQDEKQNQMPIKPFQQKQILVAPSLNEMSILQTSEQDLKKPKYNNFQLLQVLGQGAFAKVFLVKHIFTGQIYALKALKKKTLIVKKQLKYALSQANVLKKVNHQFIINLHYAFQTPNYLYLALDYCSGRDLNYHIQKEVVFPQEDTRFYLAQLILALEHLHSKNIIYRDMKPQNVLLDHQGHIKLADFGLSKDNTSQQSKSFCGSPAYLSPEMLLQKQVGKQADVYGVGCVMYECLVGLPPFYSDNIPKLYQDIKEGVLKYPPTMSSEAKSLLKSLLQRDPKKRLGAKGDYESIKKHPFFSSINWQALQRKEVIPPQRKQASPKSDDSDSDPEQEDIIDKKKVQFADYDYDQNTKKINRLINFSFIRQQSN